MEDSRDVARPNPGHDDEQDAGRKNEKRKYVEKIVELKNRKGRVTCRLRLRCDWGVGIGGGLWAAGLLLSEKLAAWGFSMRGKRVLELGSGTGLIGLACAACCNPKEVVITDLQSHCPLLEFNCDRWRTQWRRRRGRRKAASAARRRC